MNLTDKPIIPPHVVARHLGDQTVILDLVGGAYFGLDPIGARIWQLIGEGMSLGEVCDTLLIEYDVTPEELQADTLDLTNKLIEQNLISLSRC